MRLSNLQVARCASKMQDALNWYRNFQYYLTAEQIVHEVMTEILGIRPEFYCLGGSVAMIAYGINLPRRPHDIDVVVPKGIYDDIVDIMLGHPKVTMCKNTSLSSGHFAIEVTKGDKKYIVDILSISFPYKLKQVNNGLVKIQDLQQILEIKHSWKRDKDKEDAKLIEDYIKNLGGINLEKTPAPVTAPAKDEEDNTLPF